MNEAFIMHRILYHQPFGILKYAMTLDGKIATTSGLDHKPSCPKEVHQLLCL